MDAAEFNALFGAWITGAGITSANNFYCANGWDCVCLCVFIYSLCLISLGGQLRGISLTAVHGSCDGNSEHSLTVHNLCFHVDLLKSIYFFYEMVEKMSSWVHHIFCRKQMNIPKLNYRPLVRWIHVARAVKTPHDLEKVNTPVNIITSYWAPVPPPPPWFVPRFFRVERVWKYNNGCFSPIPLRPKRKHQLEKIQNTEPTARE